MTIRSNRPDLPFGGLSGDMRETACERRYRPAIRLTPESGTRAIWGMLIVVQFTAMLRAVVRGAHIHAAVQVSRHVIEPPSRPDPWRNRVGGPGGPQYPIGGDDYGVSI